MIQRKKYIPLAIIIVIVGLLGVKTFVKGEQRETKITKQEKTYNTVNPKKIHDDYLLLVGRVISNEAAQVFPRRSGIVEDILVDIGDKVRKGQTLAYLLPEGVENEAYLFINQQKAQANRLYDNYLNTKIVSGEEIGLLEKKRDKLSAEITKFKSDTFGDNNDEDVEYKNSELSIIDSEISKAIQTRDAVLKDAQNKIGQARESLYTEIEHINLVLQQTLNGGTSRYMKSPEKDLDLDDMGYKIGRYADQTFRLRVIGSVNKLRRSTRDFVNSEQTPSSEYVALVDKAQNALTDVQSLIDYSTPSDPSLTDTLSNTLHSSQLRLLSSKDKYLKAVDALSIAKATHEEGVRVLEEKKQLIEKKGWTKVDVLEAELDKVEQEIKYAKARTQKNIDESKNQHTIANINYRKTSAERGRTAIKAPFSGVISKRNITVGEMVMGSGAAFDLVDVKTTLSAKAKNEIQFGLPEQYADILNKDDVITFFSPEDETVTFDAKVTRMSPQIDPVLHTKTLQAKVEGDITFPHHSSVQVKVVTGPRDSYKVDSSVLKREDQKNYVWVLKEEKPEKLFVEVIEESGEFAEIKADELTEEIQILTNYYGK